MEAALFPTTDPTFSAPKSKGRKAGGAGGGLYEQFVKSKLAIKPHAPRLKVLSFKRDRLPFLLGPGGQTLRQIELEHGCDIAISDASPAAGPKGEAKGEGEAKGAPPASAAASSALALCTKEVVSVAHIFGPDQTSCNAAFKVTRRMLDSSTVSPHDPTSDHWNKNQMKNRRKLTLLYCC